MTGVTTAPREMAMAGRTAMIRASVDNIVARVAVLLFYCTAAGQPTAVDGEGRVKVDRARKRWGTRSSYVD